MHVTVLLRSAKRAAVPLLAAYTALCAPALADEPKFGGTLRIASLESDLDAFDPLTGYSIESWEILRATTRQLVTYPGSPIGLKEDTTLVPDLAKSWDVSPDGKTYTFHLKDDIFFSGSTERPIVAGDFVYGIKRFCDPNKQVAAINYFNLVLSGFVDYCKEFSKVPTGDLAASKAFIDSHEISGVSAPDDKTLVIRSDTKNYDFLNILSMNFVSPVASEIASKYFPDSLDSRKNLPSSGPYYVASYEQGQKLVLKKAKNFKAESDEARKAYVDEIHVDFTANSEDAVVQKIQAGEADLSLYLDTPPRGTIRQYVSENSPYLHATNSGSANFITLNAQKGATSEGIEALRKPEVRQALTYAVNRAHLVQSQGGAIAAVPLSQIITSTISGYEQFDPYPTDGNKGDPEKAKELLAKAGYPNGITLDALYRTNAQGETIAVTLKEDLAAAGITLNLIPVPSSEWRSYIQDPKSRWDVFLNASFSPDWQGPSTRMLLGGWLNSDASPCGPGNVYAICYSNPELNKLAAEAYPSDNPTPLWTKADQIVSTDLPWIPLFEKRKIAITSDRISHWVWSSLAVQADITNIALKN